MSRAAIPIASLVDLMAALSEGARARWGVEGGCVGFVDIRGQVLAHGR